MQREMRAARARPAGQHALEVGRLQAGRARHVASPGAARCSIGAGAWQPILSGSQAQTLAALGATGGDDLAATARLHAHEKAVSAGATDLRRLVGAFHGGYLCRAGPACCGLRPVCTGNLRASAGLAPGRLSLPANSQQVEPQPAWGPAYRTDFGRTFGRPSVHGQGMTTPAGGQTRDCTTAAASRSMQGCSARLLRGPTGRATGAPPARCLLP